MVRLPITADSYTLNGQTITEWPTAPTNTSNGWLVWDSGSNCFWRVVATNLRFYVWEAK